MYVRYLQFFFFFIQKIGWLQFFVFSILDPKNSLVNQYE